MTVDFSEYLPFLPSDEAHHREALESAFSDAARVMSPRGLKNYLEGIRALSSLGRNSDLVMTYIEEMPAVAREVGEDVIVDIVGAAMKLSSLTSGAVITLMLAKAPLAARRLGDAEVLRGYLILVHLLAGKAPRGLRPLMENLDELLSKLTLGGLRRWAMWGANAHQRDFSAQLAYFSLSSETSRAVLKAERRGTLFIDNQRKLNFYLRALWGRSFVLRPTSGDYENREGTRPFIERFEIHVPDAFDELHGINGVQLYRATVAHCAAHIVSTRTPLRGEGLTPAHKVMIELFEDARVEALAIREFPGLRKLWLAICDSWDVAGDAEPQPHPVQRCMAIMVRRLLDPRSVIEDTALEYIAREFLEALEHMPHDPELVDRFGRRLYGQLVDRMMIPVASVLRTRALPYRDDNRFSWSAEEIALVQGGAGFDSSARGQVRKYVSAIEMANELDCELAGDDAQEIWVCATELFPYEDEGVSYNAMYGKQPVSIPWHYPEWDHQVQLYRPDWTTLTEQRQGRGDPALMDAIVDRYKPVASRIRYMIDALQPRGITRRRGYEEGEIIDLDAAVSAMCDIRRGVAPDTRINIRITRHLRDLAVLLLLDLSESTNEPVDKDVSDGQSILELTRDATGLMAWAMDSIGDPFAVHGFASDGRHDVRYHRFKDFDARYDDDARARLAGMRGGLSTRMGTALRHAGSHLLNQDCSRRLLLLVTDGEPADIDERDPQYLRHDARKAVEDLAARGVYVYCMTLDPHADQYVARIFGANNYAVVDRVERLPERLPAVFSALTR